MKKYRLLISIGFAFLLSSCISEPELKDPFRSFEPVKIEDGWEISSPSMVNLLRKAILKIRRIDLNRGQFGPAPNSLWVYLSVLRSIKD